MSTGSLVADGYCLLSGVLPPEDVAALFAEADTLAPTARRMPRDEYLVDGQRIASPRRMSGVAAGPVLRAIQHDPTHVERLEQIVGHRLSPTSGAYIYYAPGDYLGLHKDKLVCRVTLITGVAGELGPLVIHPSLAGLPADELMAISRAHTATPPGGTEVVVPSAGSFLLLLGSEVPHHRPAARNSGAIATYAAS